MMRLTEATVQTAYFIFLKRSVMDRFDCYVGLLLGVERSLIRLLDFDHPGKTQLWQHGSSDSTLKVFFKI